MDGPIAKSDYLSSCDAMKAISGSNVWNEYCNHSCGVQSHKWLLYNLSKNDVVVGIQSHMCSINFKWG